jgi:putative addiction module component (TIGR02574 family)
VAQMTPQVSQLLEKALALSTQERGALIDRLIESLDDAPAEEGVEAAWEEEIKRRMDDIRSGRVKTIPGDQFLARWFGQLDEFGPEPFGSLERRASRRKKRRPSR